MFPQFPDDAVRTITIVNIQHHISLTQQHGAVQVGILFRAEKMKSHSVVFDYADGFCNL